MDYRQISPTEVECIVSEDELKARGISYNNCTYHTPEVRALFQEIREKVIEKYNITSSNMPLIIEAIPAENELLIILSWVEDPSDSLNAHYSTFFDPDQDDDEKDFNDDNSSSLKNETITTSNKITSLDELQNEIITDIITSIGSGQISETLKKYLNEDFLNRLINAAPKGNLDGIFNNIFSDFGTPDSPPNRDKLNADKEDKEKMTKRLGRYMDAMGGSEKTANDTSIIEVKFLSIDDVQTTLDRIGFTDFKGESILIKESVGNYTLFLRPGPLSLHDFQMETQPLSVQPNASFSSKERLMYLLEHEDPIIPSNAINILSGEI